MQMDNTNTAWMYAGMYIENIDNIFLLKNKNHDVPNSTNPAMLCCIFQKRLGLLDLFIICLYANQRFQDLREELEENKTKWIIQTKFGGRKFFKLIFILQK